MKKIIITATFIVLAFFVGFASVPHLSPVWLKSASPQRDTLVVKGEVLDSETKRPLKATISYERIPTRDDIGILESDSSTGGFLLFLQESSKYKITIQAADYITNYEVVEFKDNVVPESLREVYLVPLKVGQVIVMNRLTFDRGKAKLLPESYSELDNIYKMLSEHPGMVIQLEGHTDNAGSSSANLKLSENRVGAVREYLVNKGIKKNRIRTMAYGGSRPVESNATEEGRVKNRRVEVRILGN